MNCYDFHPITLEDTYVSSRVWNIQDSIDSEDGNLEMIHTVAVSESKDVVEDTQVVDNERNRYINESDNDDKYAFF